MRIALSGYYGRGNTGDEAVLAGIIESFERRAPGAAEFTVLSADPADTRARHGLDAVDRMNLGAVRKTFRDSDLLISGGGSLLQDTTSLRSLVYYLWIVRMARSCHRPVMFYAQGIGPLRRRVARALTRIVANRVQYITVRDEESANLLRRIGVSRPPIEVTADPAFALKPANDERVRSIIAEAGVSEYLPVIGFALRAWPGGPAAEDYVDLGRRMISAVNCSLLLIPMQPTGDLELSNRIAAGVGQNACVLQSRMSPSEAAGAIGRMSGMVAMRLHALIFGAIGGVPMLALEYDPKVSQLMSRLGQGARCLSLKHFSPEAAADSLIAALNEGTYLRDDLKDRSRQMSELALVNVDRSLEVARGFR